jgi:hypothetical protein
MRNCATCSVVPAQLSWLCRFCSNRIRTNGQRQIHITVISHCNVCDELLLLGKLNNKVCHQATWFLGLLATCFCSRINTKPYASWRIIMNSAQSDKWHLEFSKSHDFRKLDRLRHDFHTRAHAWATHAKHFLSKKIQFYNSWFIISENEKIRFDWENMNNSIFNRRR